MKTALNKDTGVLSFWESTTSKYPSAIDMFMAKYCKHGLTPAYTLSKQLITKDRAIFPASFEELVVDPNIFNLVTIFTGYPNNPLFSIGEWTPLYGEFTLSYKFTELMMTRFGVTSKSAHEYYKYVITKNNVWYVCRLKEPVRFRPHPRSETTLCGYFFMGE